MLNQLFLAQFVFLVDTFLAMENPKMPFIENGRFGTKKWAKKCLKNVFFQK